MVEVVDYATARRMIDAIPALHEAISSFCNDHVGNFYLSAPFEVEQSSYPDPQVIRTAYDQGTSLVELAADQLIAFSKTMTEPVAVYGPWVCVRAVLESSAVAAWLLDPQISVDERAKRSFAFLFKGFDEQAKFIASWKSGPAKVTEVWDKIRRHAQNASRLGLRTYADEKQRIGWIGMKMPSATQLIIDIFDDENSYRLLSAMAHGHFWALMIGVKVIEDDGQSTYVKTKKHVSPSAVGYLSARAARAFAKAIWYRSRQLGWDLPRLAAILEQSFDVMRIRDSERFWK